MQLKEKQWPDPDPSSREIEDSSALFEIRDGKLSEREIKEKKKKGMRRLNKNGDKRTGAAIPFFQQSERERQSAIIFLFF